jgi:hypothetical protein
MAFVAIDSDTIKVGDPITKELFDLIKSNFDNVDLRITSLATSGGTVFIFNGDIDFVGFSSSEPDIFYYKARQDFSINDFRAQLFDKQGVASGNLVLDLQKASDTDDANFASILTASLSFDFASDAAYSEKVATIDSALNDILTDEVLRVKVTGLPTGYYGKILLSIGAQ